MFLGVRSCKTHLQLKVPNTALPKLINAKSFVKGSASQLSETLAKRQDWQYLSLCLRKWSKEKC